MIEFETLKYIIGMPLALYAGYLLGKIFVKIANDTVYGEGKNENTYIQRYYK